MLTTIPCYSVETKEHDYDHQTVARGTCEVLAHFSWWVAPNVGNAELIVTHDGERKRAYLSQHDSERVAVLLGRLNTPIDKSVVTGEVFANDELLDAVLAMKEGAKKNVKRGNDVIEVERYPHPTNETKVICGLANMSKRL